MAQDNFGIGQVHSSYYLVEPVAHPGWSVQQRTTRGRRDEIFLILSTTSCWAAIGISFMMKRQRIHGFSFSRMKSTKLPKQQGKRPTSLPSHTELQQGKGPTSLPTKKSVITRRDQLLFEAKLNLYEGTNFPPAGPT